MAPGTGMELKGTNQEYGRPYNRRIVLETIRLLRRELTGLLNSVCSHVRFLDQSRHPLKR